MPREFVQSFDIAELRLFLRQSLPLVANEGVWAMGIFAFTIVYGHMGTTELASITMLGPIEGISLEIFIGFTSAASIFISTALGRTPIRPSATPRMGDGQLDHGRQHRIWLAVNRPQTANFGFI